jgi:uncharacterized RDD family membrane protein YckC
MSDVLDEQLRATPNPDEIRYGGFWVRVVASIIDSLVLSPLIVFSFLDILKWKLGFVYLLVSLLGAAYKPWMEYSYGATLGKMALGLKVVSQTYESITAQQALLRYLPWGISTIISIISTAILFSDPVFQTATDFMDFTMIQNQVPLQSLSNLSFVFILASSITVAFSQFKQGLHDMIAKTYCIYK